MYIKIRKSYTKEYLLWHLKIEIYNGRRSSYQLYIKLPGGFHGFFFCSTLLNKGGLAMGLGKG